MKQVLGIILLVCGLIAFIRFLPECHDAPTFFGRTNRRRPCHFRACVFLLKAKVV